MFIYIFLKLHVVGFFSFLVYIIFSLLLKYIQYPSIKSSRKEYVVRLIYAAYNAPYRSKLLCAYATYLSGMLTRNGSYIHHIY